MPVYHATHLNNGVIIKKQKTYNKKKSSITVPMKSLFLYLILFLYIQYTISHHIYKISCLKYYHFLLFTKSAYIYGVARNKMPKFFV